MKTMLKRAGLIAGLFILAPGMAGQARAVSVTYEFTAVEESGRTASGRFTYSAGVGPTWIGGPHHAEHSIGPVVFQVDGMTYVYSKNPPNFDVYLVEVSLSNGSAGTSVTDDLFYLSVYARSSSLNIELRDHDGTAFDTHLALPETLDLSWFEVRRVRFQMGIPIEMGGNRFNGTIDSLTMVPEPATLANVLLGAALTGGGCWLGRRRKGVGGVEGNGHHAGRHRGVACHAVHRFEG